jgi:hypothetical protein
MQSVPITTKIKVITKLPNSEQSYKGKVKTHKYINRQNQSTTGKLWKRNDPDLVQAFLKKWWVESDFKAPNLPLSLRLKVSGCHYNSIYNNTLNKTGKTVVKSSTKLSEVNVKNTFTSHIDKQIFLTFLLTLYLYTFSLCESPSFIIFSAETEYISTRSWYRNINFLRDRIRRIFS